jgi:hypothetical protein
MIVQCVPVQQSLRHLQSSFCRFFEKCTDYPSSRKKDSTQAAEYARSAFKFAMDTRTLSIAKLGNLTVRCPPGFRAERLQILETKMAGQWLQFIEIFYGIASKIYASLDLTCQSETVWLTGFDNANEHNAKATPTISGNQ